VRWMKKLFLISVLVIGLVLSIPRGISAQGDSGEPALVITFFWGDGCPHCADEEPFLQELISQYPQIQLNEYEVYNSSENRDYLYSFGDAMGFEVTGIPVTIIGDQYWSGFGDNTAAEITSAVESCIQTGCSDPAVKLGLTSPGVNPASQDSGNNIPSWVWGVIGTVAIVLAAFGIGSLLRKPKKKDTRKRRKK
jgi:thiol-disulfide isomerase/thioredoxin